MIHFAKLLQLVILLSVAAAGSAQRSVYVMAKHLTYDVVYDYRHMSPAVVSYILNEPDFRGTITEKPKHFKMDYRLPKPRVKNDAFTFSGYQRGHLCPSGDRDFRKDWFKDTFYTSNILPMTPDCNAGPWKEIELKCRKLVKGGHRLKICCGPLWSDSFLVDSAATVVLFRNSNTSCRPSVPDSIWKVAKCINHDGEYWCWIVPNKTGYVPSSRCTVDYYSIKTRITPVISKYVDVWIKK